MVGTALLTVCGFQLESLENILLFGLIVRSLIT